MKITFNLFRRWFLILLGACSIAWIATAARVVASTENFAAPSRQEQLLNNFKVLIWSQPNAEIAAVKLRFHGGAAFDIKGKEGTAQLVADMLFPDSQTKQFLVEELDGSLDVECNYDYIEITARGRAAELNRILETIRDAVSNLTVTPQNFEKIRAARLKLAQTESLDPVAVADNAVRKQLLQDFPYGRPVGGTPETLIKIDRADVLLARDRLLTADNATLAIAGNVKEAEVLRAVKQLFGAWRKADKPLVTTFRQPDAVNGNLNVIKLPKVDVGQIRFALRGAARQSADFSATEIAAEILRERWATRLPAEVNQAVFVRHEPHVLPGIVVLGISINGGYVAPHLTTAPAALSKILITAITNEEFVRAKNSWLAKSNYKTQPADAALRFWLDADTFQINSKQNPEAAVTAVTLTQTQNVFEDWRKQTPAFVAVAL